MAQSNSSRPESRISNHMEKTARQSDNLAASIELLQKKPSLVVSSPPPELAHISQGLYPFAQLLNRATQQSWNDLNELLNQLAEPASKVANGSVPPSALESAQKRSRLLQFAQEKRNSFIKLLVLSQWSYRAIDVGKLIDLQAFFRMQYQTYADALVFTGEMKRDLVRAQTGSPDLATAIRLLSVDTTLLAKDTGLVPPKPLSPYRMLRTLKDVNRILKKRLILHEKIPEPFSKFVIHDGRVTFVIDKMFELDLSVADDNNDSQFFYIDLRFLYTPSAILPSEKIFRRLEDSINMDLKAAGLQSCFEHIINLVLSMKIAVLHQQALQLSQSIWSSRVLVLLTHRTLVVQYWLDKPGPKSWLQVGISRRTETSKVPTLSLRWVCDGSERPTDKITFDHSQLSIRTILKSVVASHTSLTLNAIYRGLCDMSPFAGGALYIGLHLSLTEPGDCCLIVQLTKKRTVRVFVEPSTGTTMLHVSPPFLGAYDGFRPSHQSPTAIINRIRLLRCVAISEELQPLLRGLHLENASLSSSCRDDLRRRFPPSVVRIDAFKHESLGDDWGIVLANGHDGDSWWIVQYSESDFVTSDRLLGGQPVHSKQRHVKTLHMVIANFLTPGNDISYAQMASLKLACLGTIVLHTNLDYIEQLGTILYTPSSSELQLAPNLHVPAISLCYRPTSLPSDLQITFPSSQNSGPVLRETVQISFRRYDAISKRAIMMVRGRLVKPCSRLNQLAQVFDNREVSFNSTGEDFFMPFACPVGVSIMPRVFRRLQRLEHILRLLQIVLRKGLDALSLSLSRIDFASPSREIFRLSVKVRHLKRLDSSPDQKMMLSRPEVPGCSEVSLRFSKSNSKQGVKESLNMKLVHHDLEVGFDSTLQLLQATRPLHEALESITTNNPPDSSGALLNVEVIPRDAKIYHLSYAMSGHKFSLHLSYLRENFTWILRDISSPDRTQQWPQLQKELQTHVFEKKCLEWTGLGNGALAGTSTVGALVQALHEVIRTHGPSTPPLSNGFLTVSNGVNQLHGEGSSDVPGKTIDMLQPQATQPKKDTDVIMIDD